MRSDLHKRLIYLDRDFIADLYEVTTGKSPNTAISKNQSKKAGAGLSLFSAEVSAQETRSYKVSTLEMLAQTWKGLSAEPDLDSAKFASEMTSRYGWFEGELSVYTADLLPDFSASVKLVKSAFEGRSGHEEAVHGRADHRISQASRERCSDQGSVQETWF
jgi:hypothetical protein